MHNPMTWRTRPWTHQQQPKTASELVADIANVLRRQSEDGNITNYQLTQIVELATNTERLKSVLTWLA